MQNFFLSPCLGRPRDGQGLKACDKLLKHAIPACRKAGIRIIWLNWGLTEQDIEEMPPTTLRAFGFKTIPQESTTNDVNDVQSNRDDYRIENDLGEVKELPAKTPLGKDPRLYKGLGTDIGMIELDDGGTTEAGRLLMRDTWNSALYPSLEQARQEGLSGNVKRKDVWIHKDRMSGLWGTETACTRYLKEQGIRTLFFAGVNTDQCVGGSLQDAVTKGWDCIMLSDACATTSPQYSQDCVEYNAARSWGFVTSCEDLASGVDNIQESG